MKTHLKLGESDKVGYVRTVCGRDIETNIVRDTLHKVNCLKCLVADYHVNNEIKKDSLHKRKNGK